MNRCEILHIPAWRIRKYPVEGGEAYGAVLKKSWREQRLEKLVFEEADCIAYYQARRLTGRSFGADRRNVDFTDLFVCVDLCDSLGRKLKGRALDNFEAIYKDGFFVEDKKVGVRTFFVRFEASGNMTRTGRLMFVAQAYKQPLTEAITLLQPEEEPKRCSISKWLAYKGLAMSSGVPAEGVYAGTGNRLEHLGAELIDRVIVVRDCIEERATVCLTSEPADESCQKVITDKGQTTNWFDGAGLISLELVEKLRNLRDENGAPVFDDPQFTSLQFRMPFCKGMLHAVDFKKFFKEIGQPAPVNTILDAWGHRHPLDEVELILTESQFKAAKWFGDLEISGRRVGDDAWLVYRERFKQHQHRLFITGKNKTDAARGEATQLTYQMLSTLRLDDAAVRELVGEAFQPYRQLKMDDEAKLLHFIDPRELEELEGAGDAPEEEKPLNPGAKIAVSGTQQVVKVGLNTNARLIREAQAKQIINNAGASIKRKAAVGKLFITGKMRYLCPDLLRMMYFIAGDSMEGGKFKTEADLKKWAYGKGRLRPGRFFAPGVLSRTSGDNAFSLTRSPHVAANEHVVANAYQPEKESKMDAYFHHLEGVCMINPRDFFAERMGGADFDGDWVRLVDNRYIVKAAEKGLLQPWIKISAPPALNVVNNQDSQWDALKQSLTTRVGEFSNIAYLLSAMAYGYYGEGDPAYSAGRQAACAELLERMVMFIGREIDRVKTGAQVANVPELEEYKQYLQHLKAEKAFLDKKDYYIKHKGQKPGESPARHFLNRLETTFEELNQPLKSNVRFNTVPLAQLIKDGEAAAAMAPDDDQVKRLAALLLAYNGFNKAVRYGVYANSDEDEPEINQAGEDEAESAAATGRTAAENEAADAREYHYLTRIIRILTEQGRVNPEETAHRIVKLFDQADAGKLATQIVEQRTKHFWALTPKEKRREKLAVILAACAASKTITRREDVAEVLCDFSLGGYNLLGYFMRCARWRRLSKDLCAQLTPEGLAKALADVQSERDSLLAGEADAEASQRFSGLIEALKERQRYYQAFFGADASRYGALAKDYFIALRHAYAGNKRSIKSKCQEIAAEIFAANPAQVVYAAMGEAIAQYDRNHAFFWIVAGEALLKYRLLVDYNQAENFALPYPEKDGQVYPEEGCLHRYNYLYQNYTADKRRIK